jgi:hypothetical protein
VVLYTKYLSIKEDKTMVNANKVAMNQAKVAQKKASMNRIQAAQRLQAMQRDMKKPRPAMK